MRWVYLFFFLIFSAFAAVQFNDPDGLTWMAAYGYAALVTIPPIFGRHTVLPAVGLAVYLIWAISLIGFIGPDWIDVEEARESLGLLIACFWMGVLLYIWAKRRSDAARMNDQSE